MTEVLTDEPVPQFVDTNVFLRHILNDIPGQSERATAWFTEVEQGRRDAVSSGTVILECVYVLQRVYGVPRREIGEALAPLLALPGLSLPHAHIYRDVFDLFERHQGLSFADCFHLLVAKDLGCQEIVSFDRGLNRVPGVTRVEPPPVAI